MENNIMVTFTTLAKKFSDNCFCNTKVAGFGEIISENFRTCGTHVIHSPHTRIKVVSSSLPKELLTLQETLTIVVSLSNSVLSTVLFKTRFACFLLNFFIEASSPMLVAVMRSVGAGNGVFESLQWMFTPP